jgi:choline dehydrogenase-like flavoprotein
VRLDGGRNADGTPSLEIDFRYTERDIDSVLRFHALLDERLRAAGRGRIEYLEPPEGRAAAVWEQTIDGFHHIGTTRMSAVPADGVVDGDCRVHGVDNLFIASSSVLRTSAEANPTFTVVCLARRLAHHLAEDARRRVQQQDADPADSGFQFSRFPDGIPEVTAAPLHCASEAP